VAERLSLLRTVSTPLAGLQRTIPSRLFRPTDMGERAASYGRRVLVFFPNAAGAALARTGCLDAAVECHRWALRFASDDRSLLVTRALTLLRLGVVAKTAGRYDEARDAYERAERLMTAVPAASVPPEFDAAVAHNRAGLALACGDPVAGEYYARAAVRSRRAVGGADGVIANDAVILGEALAAQGDDDQARAVFESALATYETVQGPNSYEVGVTLVHLGALEARHHPDRARRHYERALAIKTRTRGPRHPEVGIVHNNLGALHRRLGSDDLARAHYAVALDLLRRRYGPAHPATVICRANLERVNAR
jgi:tetratricopeptide (TPR) repeat protein